jgi:hypothetical protein
MVSVEIYGRDTHRKRVKPLLLLSRLIRTGMCRQSLVKLCNIKLEERRFGGSGTVRADRQTDRQTDREVSTLTIFQLPFQRAKHQTAMNVFKAGYGVFKN